MAGHLYRHFGNYGPPLFCKRDNGGNLNHQTVNQVLGDAMVIPINSPVYTAPYNGAVEHAQGEFKKYLRTWDARAKTTEEFTLLAEIAANNWNHKPRRCLKGKTACRSYFNKKRIRYTKRQRKAVYEWIRNLAVEISQCAGYGEITSFAWRVSAKKWLEKKDLIKILKPGKGRVAPADCSTEALARSVRGRFDHTAPPLTRLMEIPKGLRTPLAWETGNPSTDLETVSSSALLVGFGG